MKFTHQQPNDLVLGIFNKPLAIPLTVLQEGILHLGLWRFVFQIIGESHCVQIQKDGNLVWQEVLACVPLVAADCTHYRSFDTLDSHHFSDKAYSIQVGFAISETQPLPLLDAPDLEVLFPTRVGQPPVTQIRWERLGKVMVRWWTRHVYPGEGQTVVVQSYSEFRIA